MWNEIVEVLNPYEAVTSSISDSNKKFSIKDIKENIEFYRYWIKYGKNYKSSIKKKVKCRS